MFTQMLCKWFFINGFEINCSKIAGYSSQKINNESFKAITLQKTFDIFEAVSAFCGQQREYCPI